MCTPNVHRAEQGSTLTEERQQGFRGRERESERDREFIITLDPSSLERSDVKSSWPVFIFYVHNTLCVHTIYIQIIYSRGPRRRLRCLRYNNSNNNYRRYCCYVIRSRKTAAARTATVTTLRLTTSTDKRHSNYFPAPSLYRRHSLGPFCDTTLLIIVV